jgi:hypothetical protein
MQLPELRSFALVGGTALALKFGHRKSIDLDLFSLDKLEKNTLETVLKKVFGVGFQFELTKENFALFCQINGIKTDIVHYPHRLIAPIEEKNGIRFYSNRDIAAMKINAILGRGAKKDFWDLAELLKVFKLDEIIQFHTQKFPTQMLLISIPTALSYFADAEESEDPVSLNGQSWEETKRFIQGKVREYLN